MNPCACGCGLLVRQKWHIGHNRRGVPPTNKKGFTESNGYRYVWMPTHPQADSKGYIEEHRVIVEKRIGRYLRPDEDVHHKNGIRNDNRDDNLEVKTHAEHARFHVTVAESCFECGGPHRARGLCGSCYGKFARRGNPMPLPPSRGNRWSKAA